MDIRTSAFRGVAILSLTALGLAACDKKDVINIPETPPPAVEVTVAPTQVSIAVGGTATAAAVVKNSTNQSVTWASGNTAVATVSAAGVITGVAPGSTVITATSAADANAKGLVSVTVTAPVITLSVLPGSATINTVAPGNTVQLTATVSGSSNQGVTWIANPTSVATVSPTGLVTAVAAGTVVVTATAAADANVKQSAVITVVAPQVPPVGITLSPATASTTITGHVQLVALVTGSTNTGVTYLSSDPMVATVDANGLVTGVGGGTAVITATAAADATKKATAVITVAGAPPEASISIASVVDHGTGAPVDPAMISGQIDVTVNVSAVPENDVRAVVVFVDNEQVCRQNFSQPLGTTQGVATINCPVNTAEVLMPGYEPKFMNGDHVIYARALNGEDEDITEAEFCPVGGDCAVTFMNQDFVAKVTATFENTVGTWHSGIVTAHVELVKYSLEPIAEFQGAFYGDCDDSSAGDASFYGDEDIFDLTYAAGEWVGETSASDVTFSAACVGVGYLEYDNADHFWSHVHSAEFMYDTEAPYIHNAPSVGSGLYYNDAKTFSSDVNDLGVDTEDGNTIIEIRSGTTVMKTSAAGAASITTDGLAETPLNVGYQVWVYGKDALGNEAWYGPYGDFGIDFTEPTVTYTKTNVDGDSITGMAVLDLPNPVVFTFDYIDEATPPAGPAGFNPNPVSYTIVRYDAANPAGVLVADDDVNDTFDLGPTSVDGYYVVNATVTDAAGNVWNMPTFTILVDDTPPYIGTLTVPSTLTGGSAFTMSADITDNVDLGEGWSTIGYTDGDTFYWLVQQETAFGAYGLPVNGAQTFGVVTIPSVVRSIREIDPTTGLAGATVFTAKTAEYAILDVAGVEIPTLCPPVPAADDATTENCRVRIADIGPAYNVGNPTGVTYAWPLTGVIGVGTPGAVGFEMDATTAKIDARVTGAAQTFNNPFTAVYFYGVDETGRAHFLGTGSVGVTDDTILQIRTWRYTLANTWSTAYDAYTDIFALVYGPNGDVLVTASEANPNMAP